MTIRLLAVHHGGGLGGAPVSLLNLVDRLDPNEFATEVIFTEPGEVLSSADDLGIPASVVTTGGALFYSAHARLGPRSVANFVRTFPGSVQTARAELHRRRPDLLHLNTSVLLAWAAAARREHVPVVWVVREVLGPARRLRRWQASFISGHARRVVAISDAVAACFDGSVEVVHNAVDLSNFRLELVDEAAATRRELRIPPERPVVMVVGSVQRPKGHWLVLEALRQLPEEVVLVLVTGGVEPAYPSTPKGRLKRLFRRPMDNLDALLRDARQHGLEHRIVVTGFRRDIARVVAATDILVFPSLEPEGFGRPIIEAMAMARPVVATDVGPSRDLVGPDAGVLVERNPARLAGALEDLLAHPEKRQHMGRAGRARVEACFTLDRQVAAMSRIYREALAR